jgi:predicted DsbA family dithiol-disulfide isomerase
MSQIKALLFNDPSCPFGYSANPALRTLEWRYRDQIEWHLAVIGLSDPENPPPYEAGELAGFNFDFRRRYGMPFAIEPKSRVATTSRSCQVITAARLLYPGSEWRVLRTLQLLNFNTPLLLDDEVQLAEALETVPGIEPRAIMAALDLPEVQEAYEADWTHARSAEGTPGHLQGKTADSPAGVRYTAPSVIFEFEDQRLEAAGFQTIEAYDVIVANLNPGIKRMDPAEDPLDALGPYPAGLTTIEVAAVMSRDMQEISRSDAEPRLVELLGEGKVKRVPLGDDALWIKA